MSNQAQKIREIVKALPRLNCGLCGFGNCGNYAKAVTEGRASLNICIGGPIVWRRIGDVLGIKMPARLQESTVPGTQHYGVSIPVNREQRLQSLRQRQWELAQRLDALGRRVKALANQRKG